MCAGSSDGVQVDRFGLFVSQRVMNLPLWIKFVVFINEFLFCGFVCRYFTLEQAKIASRLEEEFQVEIWGVVEGGHDMDRLNNSVNLSAASFFFSLLHNSPEIKQNMIALIDT